MYAPNMCSEILPNDADAFSSPCPRVRLAEVHLKQLGNGRARNNDETTPVVAYYILGCSCCLIKSILSISPHSACCSLSFAITIMAKTNGLKALFFDIFGTCVDWRKTVTEALIDAAKQAGDTKMVLHR